MNKKNWFSLLQLNRILTRIPDYDALGVVNSTIHATHKVENAEDRSKVREGGKKCLKMFALEGRPPIFGSNLNTLAVCQRQQQNQVPQYATLYDIQRRMPLYSIYRLLPLEVNQIGSFPRPTANIWFQNPGLLIYSEVLSCTEV